MKKLESQIESHVQKYKEETYSPDTTLWSFQNIKLHLKVVLNWGGFSHQGTFDHVWRDFLFP